MKHWGFILFLLTIVFSSFAQPKITAFAPTSAGVGSTITITGSGFSTTTSNNIVFFGATKATVSDAAPGLLQVTVPSGASYAPITVLNSENSLTAFSAKPFLPITATGADTISFVNRSMFPGHSNPLKVVLGDLNDDGKPEMVIVDQGAARVSVYKNSSAIKNIMFANKVDFNTGSQPSDIVISDMNGDGKPDIIASNNSGNTVSVLVNTSGAGNISFAGKVDFVTGSNPYALAVNDMDGDGKPDVIVTNRNANSISILVNTSTGGVLSFAGKTDFSTGNYPVALNIADYNDDGLPDIAVANQTGNSIFVFPNNSTTGSLVLGVATILAPGTSPNVIASGDIDGDGKEDISFGIASTSSIGIFRNTSSGGNISFASSEQTPIGTTSSIKLTLNDFDGDGKLDIITGNTVEYTYSIIKNVSTPGNFQFGLPFKTVNGANAQGVTSGDLDGDGRPDLMTANLFGSVGVFKNTTSSVPPTISSIQPSSAGTGAVITVTGTAFEDIAEVKVGGIQTYAYQIVSASILKITIPAGAASGDVLVRTAGGLATISGFTYIPGPTITSFAPMAALSGATITITGTNFIGTTAVSLGGTGVASFNLLSSTTLTAVVGSGSTGNLSVTTAGGTATFSGFTFLQEPTIISFAPGTAIGGAVVSITGTNFTGVTSVKFGTTAATSFNVLSSTSILALVGSGSSGNISVSTAGGTATLTGFTYNPQPVVTSFSPTAAMTGQSITITGYNLTAVTGITLGGTSVASFNIISPTCIVAVVGSGASGDLSITASSVVSTLPGFIHLASRPLISSFNPMSGITGSVITINGLHFNPVPSGNIVYFGAARAVVTAASSTQLMAIVPIGATYDPISVLDISTRLSGFSTSPFLKTFAGPGVNASFVKQSDSSTGRSPFKIMLSDFDNDGKNDVAAINQSDNNISIYKNTSDLFNISFSSKTNFSTGNLPSGLAIGDLTGSGKQDIITSNYSANTVSVLRNISSDGLISFATKRDFATGNSPYGITVNDIDGDGRTDIIVVNSNANTISILRNTSHNDTVSFAAKIDFASGSYPIYVCTGDFDGDGAVDIAVANQLSNNISLFRNTSVAGTMSFIRTDISCGNGPVTVVANDIDGDGKPELVIGKLNNSVIEVLQNNSTLGVMSFPTTVNATTNQLYPLSMAFNDFDGDGRADLVVANYATGVNSATMIKNTSSNGSVTFGSQVTLPASYGPRSVVSGDMDGDDKPDILIVNEFSRTLSAYRNITSNNLPAITSLAPLSAIAGTTLTVTGANLDAIASISLGGVAVTSFQALSSTIARITVPVNGASGTLSITTAGGTATFSGFTFLPSLTINSFTPQFAIQGGEVIINGSEFTNTTEVRFGIENAASFTVLSPTSIRAIVGNGLSGNIYVKSADRGDNTLSGFTFIPKAPIVSSFYPASGGIGTSVTINCSNIDSSIINNAVFFGATKATITVVTDSSITVTVPKGASYQPISVLNKITGLTGYSKRPFSVVFPSNDQITSGSLIAELGPGGYDYTSSVAIGDLDNDGKPDLAVVYDIGSDATLALKFFKNISNEVGAINNASSFQAGVTYNLTAYPRAVLVEDLDGDGWQDIVVTASGSISVLHNIPGIGFFANPGLITKQDFTAGTNTGNARIFDMNMDGKPEIITANANSNDISVFLNTTTTGIINSNSFNTKISIPTATEPHRIAVGDIDGDGKPDIAVASAGNPGISIHKNISNPLLYGSITFEPRVDLPSNKSAWGISMGDIDGDLKPDLVSYNYEDYTCSVFRNIAVPGTISSASFAAKKDFSVSGSAMNGTLGDIDGDGKVDIIVTPYGSNIYAFKNNSTPGDISLSNAVSFPGKTSIGYSYLVVGDLDGDSKSEIVVANGMGNAMLNIFNNRSELLQPTITSFGPTSASIGTTITVTGTNLKGVISASFGGIPVASFKEISPSTLAVIVANGATGSLSVTTAGGTATLSGFIYLPSSQKPTIASITPNFVVPGTPISITGTNFTGATAVKIGTNSTSSVVFTVLTSTMISAIMGNDNPDSIFVTTPGGTVTGSGLIRVATPTITSYTPNSSGAGATITIRGTDFWENSVVKGVSIGGVPAVSFNVAGYGTLTAVAGAGASGNISVTTIAGRATISGFTYLATPPAAPTITSFAPASATAGATLTVTGTNFNDVAAVTLNGMPVASYKVLSPTLMSVVLGNGYSGALSITTPGGTASKAGFVYITPSITIVADSALCKGKTVKLTASVDAGVEWYKNDNLITGINGKTYIVTGQGSYYAVIVVNGIRYASNIIYLENMPQPVASFKIDTDSVQCLSGNMFRFTNTSTITGDDARIVGAMWSLGDGAMSNVFLDPKRTYANPGTYNVQLVVNSNNQCKDTVRKTIVVARTPSMVISDPPAVCNLSATVDLTAATVHAGSDVGLIYKYGTDTLANVPVADPAAIAASGTYYIKGTNDTGCYNIKPVVVKINALPDLPSITGDATVCLGTAIHLQNAISGGVWSSSNNTVFTMDSTGKVNPITAGTATAIYTFTNTVTSCANSVSKSITVTALPIAGKAEIAGYSSDTTVCYFNTLTLQSKSIYDKYLWSTGATTSSIQVTTNEAITLKVGNNITNCYSTPSVIVTARKNLTPEPVITRVTDSLVSSPATVFKWYFNNKLTPDTIRSMAVGDRGFYNVSTSNDKICWNTSMGYLVLFDPVVKKAFELSVYPNPTAGAFNLQLKFERNTSALVRVTIVDQSGNVKWNAIKLLFSDKTMKIPVNLNLPKGIYSVKVDVNGEINTQQFVVM